MNETRELISVPGKTERYGKVALSLIIKRMISFCYLSEIFFISLPKADEYTS